MRASGSCAGSPGDGRGRKSAPLEIGAQGPAQDLHHSASKSRSTLPRMFVRPEYVGD